MITKYKIFEYTNTKQDKIDDMNFINEFSKKFEDMFECRLNLETSEEAEFRDYLGFGASIQYVGDIVLDNKKILSKKVNIKYTVILDTDINPNGVTNENDIDRTFTIKFSIYRNKSRNVNQLKHFYSYSRNIDDVLEKFNEYILNVLYIDYISDEDREKWEYQRDFNKNVNKYNL